MTQIIIPLRVASKKNHRRNFRNVSLPSKAYVKFHSLAAEYLLPYRNLRISQPFSIKVDYEIKGKFRQDLDNAFSSVLDCLQDYGVIEDDNLCIEATLSKTGGHKEWRCIIEL